MLFCIFAIEARAFEGTLELEINTPAKPLFSETVWNPEYEWRDTSALGRLAGHGFYEWSDVTREWFTRNSASWAPFEKAPFLATAIEYGASENGDFWQGGISFVASRLPPLKKSFDHLSLTYFTNIRDTRFSSEWALRAETTFEFQEQRRLQIEGIYRHRPSAPRAEDSGNIEIYWYSKFGDAMGLVMQKTDERWMPWLSYRVPIF